MTWNFDQTLDFELFVKPEGPQSPAVQLNQFLITGLELAIQSDSKLYKNKHEWACISPFSMIMFGRNSWELFFLDWQILKNKMLKYLLLRSRILKNHHKWWKFTWKLNQLGNTIKLETKINFEISLPTWKHGYELRNFNLNLEDYLRNSNNLEKR